MNRARDERVNAALAADGWSVMRFWDFEVEADAQEIAHRVGATLDRLRA
ncbi:DUF559 domain-containing protein [Actinomycetota bacterium]